MSKKIRALLFFLSLIFLMQGAIAYADSIDISSWTVSSNDDTAIIRTDSSIFRSGKTSLYVSTTQSQSGKTTRISQRATGLEPSTQYRLSFWSKAKHIAQYTVVRDLFNSTDARADESGTYDWTEKTIDFTTAASASSATFQFVIAYGDGSKGEVWIDDVSLHKLSDGEIVGDNLILNGGFEEDATPEPVANAAVTAGNGSLRVSWKDPSATDLKGINIYVDGVLRATAAVGEEQYTIENLENGLEYTISLEAENQSGKKSNRVTMYGIPERAQRIPDVYADDINDLIVGINEEMEYSVDGGEWIAYSDNRKPQLGGSRLVKVRYIAEEQAPAEKYKVLIFTREDKAPEGSTSFTASIKLDEVTIKGTAPSGGKVRIIAGLKTDYDTIVFVKEADAADDGSFEQKFYMPYTAPAGHYIVKCKADNTAEAAEREFVYTDSDTLNEFITRLRASSEKEILTIMNSEQDRDKLVSLGVDMDGFTRLGSGNKNTAAKAVFNKKNELSESNLDAIINSQIALGLISQSKNSGEALEILLTYQTWLNLTTDSIPFDSVTDNELIAWICERAFGKSFSNVEELSAYYKKQCAFYILNNESYANLGTVMDKYKSELGISGSSAYFDYLTLSSDAKESANRKIKLAHAYYDDTDTLIAAIKNAINAKTNTNDSTANSGGSGTAVLGGRIGNEPAVTNTPAPSRTPAPDDGSKIFTDLDSVPWADYEINSLAERGIVSGFEKGEFKPDGIVTREQLAAMTANAFGLATSEEDNSPFSDVSESRWSYQQIKAMKLGGLISGYEDGTFLPENYITREDMVSILYRTLMQTTGALPKIRDNADFSDWDEVSGYAEDGVREMYCMGLVNGIGNDEFSPKGTATRAMAAKIIYDILETAGNGYSDDGSGGTKNTISSGRSNMNAGNDSIQNDVAMLRSFGILNGGIGSLDSYMKREDYFKIICNLINLNGAEDLISAGILSGQVNETEEDADITYTQAVTILVRALGYGSMAEKAGGYPDGYTRIAGELDLLKGVSSQDEIKKSDLVRLICNACDTEILQLTEVGAKGNSYGTVDGETTLVYYHDIYRKRGIVSEVKDIGINKESTGNTEGVVIGGTYMEAGTVDAEPYLGMDVYGYYRRENDNYDPELVYIKPTSKNDVITVNADDISREKTTKSQLVYTPEGSKSEKKLKISPVADMVYNRRGYLNYTAEDFMPEVGEVRLIDNDGDGKYDCIIVADYQTLLVDRVSTASKTIFGQYGGGSVDLSRIDDYTIRNTTGAEMSISEIKNGDVIFAAISKRSDYAELTVSEDTVTGSVTAANKSDKTLVIDDTKYTVNSQIYDYLEAAGKDVMETGKFRTYYLDPDGRIAGYNVSENQDNTYGYLYKRYMEEGNKNMSVIILDEKGKWNTYTVADRITINDTSVKANSDTLESLPERQVVRFRLDSSSKVKRIDTAEAIEDGDNTEYFNKISFTKIYRSPNASFNSEFYLDGNMIIFNIPTGIDENGSKYADNRDNYSVTGNEFEDGQNYTVTLYDVDKNNRSSIVSYEKNGSDKTLGKTVFLVDELSRVSKDGEVLQSVSGVVVGQELNVTAKDDKLFDGLTRGDLIRFHINDDGRVDAVGIVQRASDEWADEEVLSNNLSSSTPAILKGTIIHIDAEKGYIKIRGTDGTRALKISNAKFAIYDKHDDEVMAAEGSDVQIGDFAVVLASSSEIKSVTVYR